ncbi:sulfotransferase domain-containing protein [Neptunitalea lumnitzerae]|uniref:Sulfotransferase domain-containing protein n=1 Tax=Neptunitalea lumnitzerae TaxID=2965509 RepID=A0ABQ5MGY6_9FLAO|nr:sulfotransferase domain-containing protein [Neptunitalea sp. Y10]GLB48655.1 hypothetical protein Y10_10230 [Neptunitalea sp. Y10]
MKKLIVHIGYPKTATTFLQNNIFNNLAANGYFNYLNNPKDNGNVPVKNMLMVIRGEEGVDEQALKDELKLIENSSDELFLLSDESISVRYSQLEWNDMNSNAKHNSHTIKEFFKPIFDDIEILFSVRNQVSIVASYCTEIYNRIVDLSEEDSLGRWMSTNIFNKEEKDVLFNYNELYNVYIKNFDETKVHILLYEDLKNDKPSYIKVLTEVFKLSEEIIANHLEGNAKHTTAKQNDKSVNLSHTLSGKLSKYTSLIRKMPFVFKFLQSCYRLVVPEKVRLKPVNDKYLIRQQTDKESSLIFDKYKTSNAAFARKLSLDMNKMIRYKYFE